MSQRQWYRIQAQAEGQAASGVADLYIFDDIGKSWWNDDAVGAKQFVDDLRALPANVMKARVHVNSLGGNIFEGVAIANALRDWQTNGREVETIVDGIAASIASVVIMAGKSVVMGDNAMLMVHAPWSWQVGNAKAMRKMADILDDLRSPIVASYRWHSSLSDEELLALLDGPDGDGTWMTADQAIEKGFATVKIEGLKAVASIDPRAMAKFSAIPESFKARVEALIKPEEKPAPAPADAMSAVEVMRACQAAGFTDLATELVEAQATAEQVTARLAEAKTAKAAATARATEITALCAAAKVPTLAAGYISGAMSVADIKAHITEISAALDKAEIDASLDPDHGARPKSRINVTEVYAKRNGIAAAAKH